MWISSEQLISLVVPWEYYPFSVDLVLASLDNYDDSAAGRKTNARSIWLKRMTVVGRHI